MSSPNFVLFVLIVFLVDILIIEVWARDPPPRDTVLRYEPDAHRQQNDINHKLLNVDNSNVQFKFKDCGNQFSTIRFLFLDIEPSPIVTPGQIRVSFRVEVKETIVDKLEADVNLTRIVGSNSINIPCIGQFGSCIYKDICKYLKSIKRCPFEEYGINCECPFKKGIINLPLHQFNIEKNIAPSGTFTVSTILYHESRFAGCVSITLTFSQP